METIVMEYRNDDGTWVDKTGKRLYLTAKDHLWDDVEDDANAIFKVQGTIPSADEPGRVEFAISKTQTYQDPTKLYFCDIVETDTNGNNPRRVFVGEFVLTAGPNNEQAGA